MTDEFGPVDLTGVEPDSLPVERLTNAELIRLEWSHVRHDTTEPNPGSLTVRAAVEIRRLCKERNEQVVVIARLNSLRDHSAAVLADTCEKEAALHSAVEELEDALSAAHRTIDELSERME